jgi:carbon monoxide dehydrogenase subunit G
LILKIIIGVAVVIVAVLVFAATRPGSFYVQRSAVIKAKPEKIFALINDFHNWDSWSPNDMNDSSIKRTYSGPASGTGAISDWDSSGRGGKGHMEILESAPPTKISVMVDFAKPIKAHNLNEFALEPAGDSTRVTWSIKGTNFYPMKVMGIFMNMENMFGKHFDEGLNNLKTIAEKQ